MEVFDAHMMDIPVDLDVHMHTNFSSPKPWIEATMDDDSTPLVEAHGYPADVEVEMEQEFQDGVEYEMDDGEEGSVADNTVDIVFVDAHVGFDSVLGDHASSTTLESDILPQPHSTGHLDSATGHELIDHEYERSNEASLHVSHETEAPAVAAEVTEVTNPETSDSERIGHTDTLDNLEETRPEPFDAPAAGPHDSEILTENPQTEESRHNYIESEIHENSQENHHDEAGGERHDIPDDGPYEEHVDVSNEESGGLRYEEPHGIQQETVDEYQALPLQPEQVAEASQEENVDPHEISDGVYIEPPPAVLLELPSSSESEQLGVCLFNKPLNSEGSRSHSPDGDSLPSTSYHVLLQQHPTLYYEPLSEVFKALRQVEVVSNLPDVSDGELLIDAYDLSLVASEDNVFSREITLHDLNILHDGYELLGPLRLRLRCNPFRFITRYRVLRQQVYQLNLADSGATTTVEGEIQESPLLQNNAETENEYDSVKATPFRSEGDGQTTYEEQRTIDELDADNREPDGSGDGNVDEGQPPQIADHSEAGENGHKSDDLHSGVSGNDEPATERDGTTAGPGSEPLNVQDKFDDDSESSQTSQVPEVDEFSESVENQIQDEQDYDEPRLSTQEYSNEDATSEKVVNSDGEDEETLDGDEGVSVEDHYTSGDVAVDVSTDAVAPQDDLPDDEHDEVHELGEQSIKDPVDTLVSTFASEHTSPDLTDALLPTEANSEYPEDWELDADGESDWEETTDSLIEPDEYFPTSDSSLKRRYIDVDEDDENDLLIQERKSLSPDSKRTRVK